jgi:hypothetical protein
MRGRILFRAVRVIAAAGLLTGILIGQGCKNRVSYEEVLRQNAEAMNRRCPLIVQEGIRLDSTSAGPGKRFTYNYTLINQSLDSIDIQSMEKRLRPILTNNLRTSESLEILRKNKPDVNYRFLDKNGRLVQNIVIHSEDYTK